MLLVLAGCSPTVSDWVVATGLSRQLDGHPTGFHTRDAPAVQCLSGFETLNPLSSILVHLSNALLLTHRVSLTDLSSRGPWTLGLLLSP